MIAAGQKADLATLHHYLRSVKRYTDAAAATVGNSAELGEISDAIQLLRERAEALETLAMARMTQEINSRS